MNDHSHLHGLRRLQARWWLVSVGVLAVVAFQGCAAQMEARQAELAAGDLDAVQSVGLDHTPGEAGPSLVGLDRSHWPTMTVGPAGGTTHHFPFYHRDVVLDQPDDDEVDLNAPVKAQLRAALSGTKAGAWNAPNAIGFVLDPFKFLVDTGALPVTMVKQWPFSDQTTP